MITCANPLAQYQSYKNQIDDAILRVLTGGRYVLGDEVEALEAEFAKYIGVKYAIGVANGTDAIEIALRALGISVGDEVITVSHTAVATISAIESAGAKPVLVDIDPDTFTLNVSQLKEVFTKKTKAIIAVHIYGQSADIDKIQKFCNENNLRLIEDVAQAHGAKLRGGRLGSFGDVSCFSCYPTKNLGAIGDAGLIVTNNEDTSKKIKMLRQYGWAERYVSDIRGRNSRLDEIQAAILRVKLTGLDADNEKRAELANLYNSMLVNLPIKVPAVRPNASHVFHLYVIRVKERDRLNKYLVSKNIFPGIHYPVPIHLQPAYANSIKIAAKMDETEIAANEVLSLPIYPELKHSDIQTICEHIKKFY